MKDQEFGIEGLGKMEGIGKGPMGIFGEIGTEKNLLKHRSLLLRFLDFSRNLWLHPCLPAGRGY
jgi:hypothetical protein